MAAALASSPLVHLTASRLRLPRPRASASSSAPGCWSGVCLGWRLTVGLRAVRRCDRLRCFSTDGGSEEEGEKHGEEETSAAAAAPAPAETQVGAAEELASERSRSGSFSSSSSSSGTPGVSSEPPLLSFSVDNIDTVKLLELLGPEKVDPVDVKAIKEKLFGYTTFWLTKEEPFGDLGEGVLFIGNLRGKREEIFAKLQRQLRELTGDKYNLFMVEEPNSEGDDPRGGPRVSFGLLRKEVSEPGPTTLWQYVISLLLFLLTMFSCVELGIASKISSLPPEIVSYFTDPNATGPPPDMQLLLPFVESALPVAYGVLAIQLFHEIGHFLAAFPKNVKLGIPFFIPNFTLGTFGAITQFKSILPDRKTMFDISMAGPVAGAALSFSMFFVGLLLSSNPVGASDLVEVPSQLFQGSLLLGLISRATLGYSAMHAATVSIHPLVIAGWCGLTTTAFNMLPVGCLDGGRALQGAFGKEALFGFGLTTYSLLGLGVLGGPLSLPWGLYVLICQRTPEKPCLNDVSDVGSWRRAALIASVFLVVLTLIPLWDELAEELGVGLVTSF
ncbi:probable zinc metalloprotease EGY1, chloroplastic isoform X1 [Miscanthus floridulus]|uniref:probable zinc metalloprotease EGY1, chloroplastic isoform X1 n=1 Tax=Miscanthus floridulus TaxID=154761 RepID=UPI003458B5BA